VTTPDRPWQLLALPPLDAALLTAILGGPDIEVVTPPSRDAAGLAAVVGSADLVVGDWSGALRFGAETVRAAGRLSFYQQPSAGVDSIDVAALTAGGVPVANIGPANAVSVAEWCVGATFGVLRWLAYGDAAIRRGEWPQLELARRGGGELAGRRVGIVGMGHIGVECARRYAALGCDVAHWSRTPRSPEQAGGSRWMPLADLLEHSQLLVVVVALAPETCGLLGGEELARMAPGGFVIDAARGGIVDEAALLSAVRSGHLAGAALDVFETEPLPQDSPLIREDRILLSPHSGGATPEAQSHLIDTIVANVRRAVEGQPVDYVVNGVDAVIRRREA
jgi:phosphoglycerate dehydrogenase-like enzyme